MSKIVRFETEDDFFARIRKLAGQIDRNEIFGDSENVSFQDADEMRAYLKEEAAKEEAAEKPPAYPSGLDKYFAGMSSMRKIRKYALTGSVLIKNDNVLVTVSDKGEKRVVICTKNGVLKRRTGPKRA